MSLSTIPTELKMCILENIEDYSTLRNIVHASPQFHQIYSDCRQRLLSQVTIRYLEKMDIIVLALSGLAKVEQDAPDCKYAMYLEMLHLREPTEVVHYMRESNFHQPVLEIDHSLALLRYAGIIPWKRSSYFGKRRLTQNKNPALEALVKSRLDEGRSLAEFLFIGGYPDGSMKNKLFRSQWRRGGIFQWQFAETSVKTLHCEDLEDWDETADRICAISEVDLTVFVSSA